MQQRSSILAEIAWLAYFFAIFVILVYAFNIFVVPHHFNDRVADVLAAGIAAVVMIAAVAAGCGGVRSAVVSHPTTPVPAPAGRLIADLLTLARAGREDFLRKERLELDLFLGSLVAQGPHLGDRRWTVDRLPGGAVDADQDRRRGAEEVRDVDVRRVDGLRLLGEARKLGGGGVGHAGILPPRIDARSR